MSTLSEIKNIPEKFKVHIENLVKLLNDNKIKSRKELINCYRNDEKFQAEWKAIWIEIAKSDGGKLSLTTIGLIIGSVLGGVGIAAMGSAIGMPLALILGLGGFILGNKIDDKSISINLSSDLLNKLEKDSIYTGTSVNNLIEHLVELTYEKNINNHDTLNNSNNEIGFIESSIKMWSDVDLSKHILPKEDDPKFNDEDIPIDSLDCYEYRGKIDELYELIENNEFEIEELKENINSLEYSIQHDLGFVPDDSNECNQ